MSSPLVAAPDSSRSMLRAHFLMAFRSLRRDATVTLINIVGMAAGLACCLLIGLFVYDELGYDRHHEHADRVVRIVSDLAATDTRTDFMARTSQPVADALREQFPQVERAGRIAETSASIRISDQYLFGHLVYYAEPDIADILTIPVLRGDLRSALTEPHTAAITKSFAERLFGRSDVVGEAVVLNDTVFAAITAVLDDPPPASHFRYELLVSYATYLTLYPRPEEPTWLELSVFTYALLRPGTDVETFRSDIRDLAQREYASALEIVGVTLEFDVEPVRRIYLHSERQAQLGPTSDAATVGLFAVVALVILLIACINYMNLATARALKRSREVGVRKALGAGRGALVNQFLFEALLLTTVAAAVSLFLVAAGLGWFNELAGKTLNFTTLLSPGMIAVLLLLVTVVGILAGIYPALVLSRSEAAQVVRGTYDGPLGGARLRQVLVVLQFAASIVLIAATLAALRQLDHMRSQDLGFDPVGLVVFHAPNVPAPERGRRFDIARSDIQNLPGVHAATASSASPGDLLPLLLTVGDVLEDGETGRMHYVFADEQFAPTYGLRLLAGRMLSREYDSDRRERVMINESAVETLGWSSPEDAIGRRLYVGSITREVVGVFRDYHHFALRQAVEPMVLMPMPAYSAITVRMESGAASTTIAEIESLWSTLFPGYPFSYTFVSDAYEQQYDADLRLSVIMSLFAGLAILLACLGLFGLMAHTTSQRRKEIGVRKSFGASIGQIVVLLMRSVVILVLFSILLAIPIAYLGLRAWMEGFPYPARIGPSIFVVAGVIVMIVAIVSVSSLATRAAVSDPTVSLRRE